jgi:hypothetical protein
MPIITPEQPTTTWRDLITQESLETLINGMIGVKKYYAMDELYVDVNRYLVSGDIMIGGELVDIVNAIWTANLPVVEDILSE